MAYVLNNSLTVTGTVNTDTLATNIAGEITVPSEIGSTNATNSVSVGTGAINTVGGLGVTLDTYIGGTLNVNTGANILNSNTLVQSGNGIGVNAGTITLLGGTSDTGTGGEITITGGNNTSSGSGGDVTITAGNSNSVQGGSIILNPGSGSTAGEVVVNGKLTVTGLIDPTGMVFEEQAATPYDPTATTQGTLWVRDDNPNVIVFTDNAGTDTVLTGVTTTPNLDQVLTVGNNTGGNNIIVDPTDNVIGDSSGANGGNLNIRAGIGTSSGGNLLLTGGTISTVNGDGGNVNITAGDGGTTSGRSGNVTITAGTTSDTLYDAGIVTIMGGDTNTDNPLNSGGDILLIAGDNTGTGGPIGNVSLTAGVGPSGTYGDIIFDANGAIAPIPVNSVSDPDLETTAQNIVGAINELYNNSILGPITYISADVLWSGTSVINFTSIVITPGTWLLSGTGSFNIATGIGILWLSTVSTSSTSTIQGSQRTLASINYNPAAINCVITVASNTTIYWNGMTTNGANTGLAIDVTVVGSGPALSNEPVLMAIKLSV